MRDETLSPDIDLASLAKRTESFSGSDLKRMSSLFLCRHINDSISSVDLCVSAALAAVKEGVNLPWDAPLESPITLDTTPPLTNSRIIHPRHFTRALKEITPSSSETLGSLADLRKWNEQFGEGRQDKRRVQVWGKGRFGFTDATVEVGQDEGRVAEHQAKSSIEQ